MSPFENGKIQNIIMNENPASSYAELLHFCGFPIVEFYQSSKYFPQEGILNKDHH